MVARVSVGTVSCRETLMSGWFSLKHQRSRPLAGLFGHPKSASLHQKQNKQAAARPQEGGFMSGGLRVGRFLGAAGFVVICIDGGFTMRPEDQGGSLA